MSKHATEPGTEGTSSMDATAATARQWPKVIASPAVWEGGAAAQRLGRMPRSLYRPRRLAISPERLSILW
ncbi:MAG TPA: hypothetical protein VGG06_35130 [Thermoanaerobaculia bacterium]